MAPAVEELPSGHSDMTRFMVSVVTSASEH